MVDAETGLRIQVLGPLRAWRGADELALGSAHRRAVLAVLALSAGHPVSRHELIDAVWGETPPAGANGSIYTYVSGLRRVLDPELAPRSGDGVLASTGPGYTLRLARDRVDVHEFDVLRSSAGQRRAAGDVAGAVTELDEALALYRGEPLAGLPGPYAQTHRARLTELRLTVVENRAELLLELGRYGELVGELSALCGEYPLRERLPALLMSALHDSGRTAEALAVYDTTATNLSELSGIDPGPELRDLREQLLGTHHEYAHNLARSGAPAVQLQEASREELSISVLGPVTATRNGTGLKLGPTRQRAVFALLALNARRLVPRDELVAAVWGEHPPASVKGNVHTYVSGLRQALGTQRELLVRMRNGYSLRIDPERVDAIRLELLIGRGRNLTGKERILVLEEALDLWNGDPLSGVPGPHAEQERIRLGELRLLAHELRAQALLDVGADAGLGAELGALAEEYPLRERFRELQMLALHRAGQHAAALGVFRDARARLVAELGTEPGAELHRLQARILAQDPELNRSASDR